MLPLGEIKVILSPTFRLSLVASRVPIKTEFVPLKSFKLPN
jgi:hypothetical protein